MGKIRYCPMVGRECSKTEIEIRFQKDTFFLAEPFNPEQDRKRRERAIKTALKEALKEGFSETSLRVADKEPKDPAFFCDICRLIQSSAYGIVDISGLNPNVLLELGMMFSLGKPVFVLVEKSEEKNLEQLPSDILWKTVIPYEQFIDIEEKLSSQIQNRPKVETEPTLAEEAKKMFEELNPPLAQMIEAAAKEIKRDQEEGLKNLEKLLIKAKLDESMPREKEIEIPFSLEKQINELYSKVEQIEKLVGFPENPEIAFLRGNWLLYKKEYDKSLELFDWALTQKLNFLEAWNNKGIALYYLGRFEEAITCYDKAIEIKQDYYEVWNNKGNALSKLGRFEEAITCYDKAIEIKQDYEIAWVNKGYTLSKQGKLEEAKSCYEKALKINPNSYQASNNLSDLLLAIGDLARGLEIAKKALSLAVNAEDKVTSWYLCISAYLFKEEDEKAQEEIKELENYLKGLGKDFKVTEKDFSLQLAVIEERLDEARKIKLLSLISLLKGEIGLEEFERRIKILRV